VAQNGHQRWHFVVVRNAAFNDVLG
jgi:hypothetical protein